MNKNKPLNRIKVVMAERMVTNSYLCNMLDKDPATISRWVTNRTQPTLENLIEIAKVLKCDIGELIRMDDSTVILKAEQFNSEFVSTYAH